MRETPTTDDPLAGAPPVHRPRTTIILLTTVAAIVYGIVHDQITARLCVEYFTIAHAPLFPTTSPTILGICWGIAATFGVGALFGVVLARVSQSDGLPLVPILRLGKSVLGLLAMTAICASLAGVVGYELSRRSIVGIPATLAELIPPRQYHRFMAVWFIHGASYLVGVTGGSLVILRIWWARGKPPVLSVFPHTKGAIIRALIVAAIAAFVVWLRFAK